jgi:hypothetical protein
LGIGIGYRYWVLVLGIGILRSLDYSRLQIVSYALVVDTS